MRLAVFMVLAGVWSLPGMAQTNNSASQARAVLEKHCMSCHGAAKMAGLDLRARTAMLKGGARGAALVPGDASASLLYRAAAQSGDLKMPPGKPPLAAAELSVLRQWIEA